jgi:dTDP-glucose 4,6-dehydratase
MSTDIQTKIRAEIMRAVGEGQATRELLANQRIAVTGGTGFLGSWLAETVSLLNDEYRLGIELHLYARYATQWAKRRGHLAARNDITLHNQDVRAPFEFPAGTALVIHAAGIPDNRVHASDPLRVFETTVHGAQHALEAASKLTSLKRFVHVSSGLVCGAGPAPLSETAVGAVEPGKVHLVYPDAKRTAESLCAIYRSQHRLPISVIRPFTFIGPYQELDRPWAVNNFVRDALAGSEIRLHGEGITQRSYLYGSDAAWWTLCVLVNESDRTYNIGSAEAVSHYSLARSIAAKISPPPSIVLRTLPPHQQQNHDFLPDVSRIKEELGVQETCGLEEAIETTIEWHRANG